MISSENVQAEWKKYKVTHDLGLRERLLSRYLPLVKQIAGRMLMSLPKSVSLDELVSSGIMGLISAVDHYDPTMDFVSWTGCPALSDKKHVAWKKPWSCCIKN